MTGYFVRVQDVNDKFVNLDIAELDRSQQEEFVATIDSDEKFKAWLLVALEELCSAQADNSRLRDALEAVEWITVWDDLDQKSIKECPSCLEREQDGHNITCRTEQALAGGEGGDDD
ncbi:MAG: hypothetical protein ACYSW6_11735 [Planctomycetota bacterium]|jgi:hypothetical protein